MSIIHALKHHGKTVVDTNKKIEACTKLLRENNLNRFQKQELDRVMEELNVKRYTSEYQFYHLKQAAGMYVQYSKGIVTIDQWLRYAKLGPPESIRKQSKLDTSLHNAIAKAQRRLQNVKQKQQMEYLKLETTISGALRQHATEYVYAVGGIDKFLELRTNIMQRSNDEACDAMKHWCVIASQLKGDVLEEACIHPLQLTI